MLSCLITKQSIRHDLHTKDRAIMWNCRHWGVLLNSVKNLLYELVVGIGGKIDVRLFPLLKCNFLQEHKQWAYASLYFNPKWNKNNWFEYITTMRADSAETTTHQRLSNFTNSHRRWHSLLLNPLMPSVQ